MKFKISKKRVVKMDPWAASSGSPLWLPALTTGGTLYSDSPLLRQPITPTPIVPTAHCSDISRVHYSDTHCSDSPMFRQIFTRGQYSDNPIFRQPIVPTAHCSDFALFRQPIGPTVHCFNSPLFWRSMFRQLTCKTGHKSAILDFSKIRKWLTWCPASMLSYSKI